jgi:hypothetical protein
MSAKPPPVPPANRPKSGPDTAKDERAPTDTTRDAGAPNTEQQGRQGDIHQNTHHQGYQQDR